MTRPEFWSEAEREAEARRVLVRQLLALCAAAFIIFGGLWLLVLLVLAS